LARVKSLGRRMSLCDQGCGAALHGRLVMADHRHGLDHGGLEGARLLKHRESSARGGGEKPSVTQVLWQSAACRRTLRDPRKWLENRRVRVGKMCRQCPAYSEIFSSG
jgi:hypothetical protein